LPKSPLIKICELCEVFLSIQTLTNNTRGKEKVERAKVVKEEVQVKDMRFLAVYVESKNSIMIMLSEKEDKLGTLAIAVPKPKDLLDSVTSSVLLGDKNVISARMFAELVASKKGKIAMVSVYLETVTELQAQSFFMHLIDKLIKSESQKEPTAI
jgi:hypothetical protein